MEEEVIDYDDPDQSSLWDNYMEVPLMGGALFEGVVMGVNRQHDPSATQVISSQEPKQNTILIGEIPVMFPGEPYDSQRRMMENIIESLNNNDNSLIESPTGSGKTLALLCAVLAWKKHQYLRDPGGPSKYSKKVFYCTKTHAQISTVIKELRKTAYSWSEHAMPRLNVTVLGSRGQMCVNESVIAGANESENSIDDACDKLRRNFRKNNSQFNPPPQPLPTCPFYKDPTDDFFFMEDSNGHSEIRDIEDLRKTSQVQGCCAFFGSRRQLPQADLVICPYNYIISSFIRRSLQIDLKNCILIFDEGHNLEKALCTEGSVSLSGKLFGEVFLACRQLSTQSDVSDCVKEAAERLFNTFYLMHTWMKSFEGVEEQRRNRLPSGMQVVSALSNSGFGVKDVSALKLNLDHVTDIIGAERSPTLDKVTSQRIQKVISVLDYLYKYSDDIEDNFFLELENIYRSGNVVGERINIMCVNPALVFQDISSQTSTIAITSGTLTPLDSYAKELNIPFRQPLSLEQTIPLERYWVAKLAVTPDGRMPNLLHRERSKSSVKKQIGEAIVRICEVVPNGVIVFFPSKECISDMMESWQFSLSQSGSIMERIKAVKHVVSECDMREPQMARKLLQEYREKSINGSGALFLGVHRGKVSEGVDFSDREARAVINVGIPLAPPRAASVTARRKYHSRQSDRDESYWKWYLTDALRAVNQGLGRSVRHHNDWGAIIMMDPRFLESDISQLIPPWIENASNVYHDPVNSGFDSMISDLTAFVSRMIHET